MQVPLLDLKAQFSTIQNDIEDAVRDVLHSQQFINGPQVSELEERIGDLCDCSQAVAVSSGTDALLCALMALGIGEGDEVITTPYTFFATAGSIWRAGATPVFVDISPVTFNLNIDVLEAAVTPRTRAIMPVHLFGQCADMDGVLAVAAKHSLAVVEDACQAIGATYKGRKAGGMGTAGCFSFFPSKNLGGLGDGGMIVTRDRQLADRMRAMRQHGETRRYHHEWVGGNFRLDTLQAAGLLAKLPHLEAWSEARRANARYYDQRFADCPHIRTPQVAASNVSIYNQYTIRTPSRDALREWLTERQVGSAIYYPLSLHRQECFKTLGYSPDAFPESEAAAGEALSLPVYAELTDAQRAFVADSVLAFWQ